MKLNNFKYLIGVIFVCSLLTYSCGGLSSGYNFSSDEIHFARVLPINDFYHA